MSKKREQKTMLFSMGGQSGQWTEPSGTKSQEPQTYEQEERRTEQSERYTRRSYEGEGGEDRRPYGERGGRGGYRNKYNRNSYRERDKMIREEDDDYRPKYSTGSRGGYDRGEGGRRGGGYSYDRPLEFRKKEEEKIPDEKPFRVIVSNISPTTDEMKVGEYFEGVGCKLEDVRMNEHHEVILEMENKDSVKLALEKSRDLIDDYSIVVSLYTEAKKKEEKEYVPPSGRDGAGRGREDRYNDRYNDRYGGGGYSGGYGRYDRGGYRGRRGGGSYQRNREGGEYRQRRFEEPHERTEEHTTTTPGERPKFTVDNIQPRKAKENPFGEAKPKDIK